MSLATKIADKCNTLYSLITNTNKEVSSNIDSSITGNGYMEVSRKLDNFEFLEDANATYKVVDKNRYVKIGDKVIDTYGEELINPDTPFSVSTGVIEESTNKFTWDSSANNVAYQTRSSNESGKVYMISFNIDEYTSGALQGGVGNIRGIELKNSVGRHSVYIISDTNTFIGLEAETTFVGKVSDISVKEVQTADFTNTAPNVTVVTTNAGVTGSKGDYFIDDVELAANAWVLATGWTDSGTNFVSDGTSEAQLRNDISLGVNTYNINYEIISQTSGVLEMFYGAGWIEVDSTVGKHTITTDDRSIPTIYFRPKSGNSFIGSIDKDISVKKARSLKQATRDTADMFDYINTGSTNIVYLSNNDVVYLADATPVGGGLYNHYYKRQNATAGNFDLSLQDYSSTLYWKDLGTASGMSLDNPYFRDREDYGVTHQAIAYHAFNTITNIYDGILTEILMNDMSVFATPKIVMEANEFTSVGSFLYQKGDYLCVPVVRTQMRNEGVYHPVYNPKGTRAVGGGGADTWYSTRSHPDINSVSDAFKNVSTHGSFGTGTVADPNGNLAWNGSGNVELRPDGKYYDVVYANDTIDMREFAKKATQFDIDLLRQDRIDNALKNEVSMKSWSDKRNNNNNGFIGFYNGSNNLELYTSENSTLDFSSYRKGDRKSFIFASGAVVNGVLSEDVAKDIYGYFVRFSSFSVVGTIAVSGSNITEPYITGVFDNNIITSYSTDLIGDPANYPAMITDRLGAGLSINGIYPLLVSDNGDNLIPNGTVKSYKASKKVSKHLNYIWTGNNGTTWTLSTGWQGNMDAPDNAVSSPEPTGRVLLVNNETSNDPYEVTDALSVIDVEPKVIASNSHSVYKGGKIASQIAGKITTGNGSRGLESKTLENIEFISYDLIESRDIHKYPIGSTVLSLGLSGYCTGAIGGVYLSKDGRDWGSIAVPFSNSSYFEYIGKITPEHNAVLLDKQVSATAKWFNVLEEDSYCVHAGIYGQELVWDTAKDDGANDFIAVAGTTSYSFLKGTKYKITSTQGICYVVPVVDITIAFDNLAKLGDGVYGGGGLTMKYWDGTGFGDSAEFSNLSNTTSTDLNGKTVRSVHGSLALNIKR